MYSKRLVVAVLALTLTVMGFGMAAYADQACSAGKSASCAKAADCPKDMKVTMTGTIEVKTEGDAKTPYLKVSEVKCEKGKLRPDGTEDRYYRVNCGSDEDKLIQDALAKAKKGGEP